MEKVVDIKGKDRLRQGLDAELAWKWLASHASDEFVLPIIEKMDILEEKYKPPKLSFVSSTNDMFDPTDCLINRKPAQIKRTNLDNRQSYKSIVWEILRKYNDTTFKGGWGQSVLRNNFYLLNICYRTSSSKEPHAGYLYYMYHPEFNKMLTDINNTIDFTVPQNKTDEELRAIGLQVLWDPKDMPNRQVQSASVTKHILRDTIPKESMINLTSLIYNGMTKKG